MDITTDVTLVVEPMQVVQMDVQTFMEQPQRQERIQLPSK